ncbi:CatA-like O-acetyltransferase [Vagococcus fluvialis]|jgi:chloramphenicol O-acetyltransferase type A|uniref:CatA-like O-acetyltransferase n=1 Tax=Vagococcus fluvialis TaxID=2738 RepID=UPI003B59C4AF
MEFIKINLDTWNRKEHYEHFNALASCSFNVTEKIDITDLISFLKRNQINFYPAYLYLVSKSVNEIKELRMTILDGELGYYSVSNPSYTVFNKQENIFYSLVTEYNDDFELFLATYYQDNKLHKNSKRLSPQNKIGPNTINISSLPWVNFSAFDINLKYDDYLQPIITNGKYVVEQDFLIMPLSIRVNHSVTDGYHVGLFFERFKDNIRELIKNSYLTHR